MILLIRAALIGGLGIAALGCGHSSGLSHPLDGATSSGGRVSNTLLFGATSSGGLAAFRPVWQCVAGKRLTAGAPVFQVEHHWPDTAGEHWVFKLGFLEPSLEMGFDSWEGERAITRMVEQKGSLTIESVADSEAQESEIVTLIVDLTSELQGVISNHTVKRAQLALTTETERSVYCKKTVD